MNDKVIVSKRMDGQAAVIRICYDRDSENILFAEEVAICASRGYADDIARLMQAEAHKAEA